jgi:hypothetical protein
VSTPEEGSTLPAQGAAAPEESGFKDAIDWLKSKGYVARTSARRSTRSN